MQTDAKRKSRMCDNTPICIFCRQNLYVSCHIWQQRNNKSHGSSRSCFDSLISSTERGSQDHKSLLAAYKLFDKYLTENNVTRPVVVLSDGHSSRFDFDVLQFLHNQQIRLFITPPDTTGVTQLLDQVNKVLHQKYKECKNKLFTTHNTINREGFMRILGEMWTDWVSRDSLVAAARRVGVSSDGLSYQNMQRDKPEQAAMCMPPKEPLTEIPLQFENAVMSPKHVRKNTAEYWKLKYEISQQIIRETQAKSIALEEIPGFLKIDQVKPKSTTTNTRVTQVHGSLEGKDVMNLVKSIKDEKNKKQEAAEERDAKKQGEKDAFFRCKEKCICGETKCFASGLKECPSCHNILKSVCSKYGCRINGEKPEMITAAVKTSRSARTIKFDSDSSAEESEHETSDESDLEGESSEDEDELDIIESMKKTWRLVSPPNTEQSIHGKWFAVSYTGKRNEVLYIAKLLQRFLVDEGGPVDSLLMRCLKPKVRSGTILEDTPSHLPPDESHFKLNDIIAGPIEVNPLRGSIKFSVPKYEEIVNRFQFLSKLDRKSLLLIFI